MFFLPTQKPNSCDQITCFGVRVGAVECKTISRTCCSGDIERQQWKGNIFVQLQKESTRSGFRNLCCPPVVQAQSCPPFLLGFMSFLPEMTNNEFPEGSVRVLLHSQMGSVRHEVRHQLECVIFNKCVSPKSVSF